jgi:hypothetical protein
MIAGRRMMKDCDGVARRRHLELPGKPRLGFCQQREECLLHVQPVFRLIEDDRRC